MFEEAPYADKNIELTPFPNCARCKEIDTKVWEARTTGDGDVPPHLGLSMLIHQQNAHANGQ